MRRPGISLRGEEAGEQQHTDHGQRPDQHGGEGDAAEHAEHHAELGRAGNGQGQQEGGDQALARAVQDARGQRRHGHAAEAEHHRQHGAAVEADGGEQAVGDDRQARQVAGILEHAEGDEEGGDDGQDQRQRVGHAHGPQAVLADQQFAQPGPTADVRSHELR
jgi:hypothetical protein